MCCTSGEKLFVRDCSCEAACGTLMGFLCVTGSPGSCVTATGRVWPDDCVCVGLGVRPYDVGTVHMSEAAWLWSSVQRHVNALLCVRQRWQDHGLAILCVRQTLSLKVFFKPWVCEGAQCVHTYEQNAV